jgi:hypothetical protein
VVEADLDEEFYENRIGKLTETERLYVAAMADLGDGPQPVGSVADLLGARPRPCPPFVRR